MRYGERTRTGESLSGFGRRPVTSPLVIVEYLVIAGGGGGGSGAISANNGGGGGAGGYRTNLSGATSGGNTSAEAQLRILAGELHNVEIGAGGAANGVGTNSIFSTITSTRGGNGGGLSPNVNPTSGGSGGGGAPVNGTAGAAGTANQGFAGGQGNAVSPFRGGGGGGAGGAGTAGVSGGHGGSGGGGNGGVLSGAMAAAGAANTGSGGGGGVSQGAQVAGAAGGSGIIILKYSTLNTILLSAGLTTSTTTVGDSKITTITAGSGTVSWA